MLGRRLPWRRSAPEPVCASDPRQEEPDLVALLVERTRRTNEAMCRRDEQAIVHEGSLAVRASEDLAATPPDLRAVRFELEALAKMAHRVMYVLAELYPDSHDSRAT